MMLSLKILGDYKASETWLFCYLQWKHPKRLFGADLYPTIYDKAAAYSYHLVQNHPFNDANKRTGFGAVYLLKQTN